MIELGLFPVLVSRPERLGSWVYGVGFDPRLLKRLHRRVGHIPGEIVRLDHPVSKGGRSGAGTLSVGLVTRPDRVQGVCTGPNLIPLVQRLGSARGDSIGPLGDAQERWACSDGFQLGKLGGHLPRG